MAKITELDRKILYELDLDGRASFSNIARKLNTTPQVIKYHYHALIDNQIIKNFWAFIDYSRVGYSFFWGYWFKFNGLTKEKEDEIYNSFNKNKNIPIIMRCDGYADVLVAIITKDIFHHNRILQNIMAEIGKYITKNDILVGIGFTKFPRSYLNEKPNEEKMTHQSGSPTKVISLSETDKKILSLLQIDGRMEFTKIAKILNVSVSLIHKKYKYLTEKKVIVKTTYTLNHKNLNIELYRNAFKITQFNEEKVEEFYNYCIKHPNVNNYVKVMGEWQVLIDFEVKNREELRGILREMQYLFKDIIQEIAINEVYQIDKFSQMIIEYPDLI